MREFTGFVKGINLGGWLSQCRDNYNEEHYSSFITEKDIERVASMGADHVRLPIDYNVIQNEDGSFIERGFKHIDDCIRWCEKNGINVILDLHKACGFIFDDADYCQFFSDERLQDIFILLWEELSRRYGNRENIAFELLNEVTEERFTQPWNRIADRAVKAIRRIAADTKIIIGGIYNGSVYGMTLLEKPYDENIVFTFHCYSPLAFTHQGAYWVDRLPRDFRMTYPGKTDDFNRISKTYFGNDFDNEYDNLGEEYINEKFFEKLFSTAAQIGEKYNIPIYCGEYGVIDIADLEGTVNWYKDINKAFVNLGIARAAWTYKEMDFGITDKHYEDIYDELIKLL